MTTRQATCVFAFLVLAALNAGLACGAPAETGLDASKRWTPQSGREPKAGDEWLNPKDGSVLVFIAGGEFTMGSDKGDEDEKPPHKVTVKSFWLGKYEVTNRQFAPFYDLGEVPEPLHWGEVGYNDPQQPIVGLIWESAVSYCKWAGLRLPSEAEWEYAAAAGKQFEYPTATGAISHDLANIRGVGGKDKWEGPAPVGQFPPTPFGLYDMAGNAWEWTSSIWKPYPYVTDGSRENFDEDNREMQVMRGGSWGYSESYCRTARRRRFASWLTYDWAGFRVACDADYPKKAAEGGAK
ncbi:MAG: formylglycine-generating enzyme family protein [Candidatus Sumerlaeia bacterium]|nr:formylglycine-generating enzyme family protein [Candidatus Sumerlaeia bacterium]